MISRDEFVSRFGGVYEHSPFIAERAWDRGLVSEPLTAAGVAEALCAVFRNASECERLGVLRAHPDLAGKLAIAGGLTKKAAASRLAPDLISSRGRSMRSLRNSIPPI